MDHQISFEESSRWTMCSSLLKTASAGEALLDWFGMRPFPSEPPSVLHTCPSKIDHQMLFVESPRWTMCNLLLKTAIAGAALVPCASSTLPGRQSTARLRVP